MAQDKQGPDPGWNDPPIFTYEKATEIQATAGKRGSLLNKRVAFPLAGGTRSSSGGDPTQPPSNISVGPPPFSPAGVTEPPHLLPTSAKAPEEAVITGQLNDTDSDRLKEVLENLGAVHNLNGGDEISKRIKIMENMWLDGKLGSTVQKTILQLTQALKNGDLDSADHAQKALMVDHVAVCSSWMVGVRQLINLLRQPQS